jgi:hypothetical protein
MLLLMLQTTPCLASFSSFFPTVNNTFSLKILRDFLSIIAFDIRAFHLRIFCALNQRHNIRQNPQLFSLHVVIHHIEKQEVLERTNHMFLLTWQGQYTRIKRLLQKFFVAAGTSLPSCYLSLAGRYTSPRCHFKILNRTENMCPIITILLNVSVSPETCLPRSCLALVTEPLPCNNSMNTHTDTQTRGRALWST